VTSLQWPVEPFQLRFLSRLKHLVTPLTADSPRLKKVQKEQVSHLYEEWNLHHYLLLAVTTLEQKFWWLPRSTKSRYSHQQNNE